MAYDFEKQIREMQQGKTPTGQAVPLEAGLPRPAVSAGASGRPAPVPVAVETDDPDAVEFPMRWWATGFHIMGILGCLGWIVYAAIEGMLDQSLVPVYAGGAGILMFLAQLPGSLRIDRHGVHQFYFLGLWQRSIPLNDISFYWQTTRGELRRARLLRFEWARRRQHGDGLEPVVYVGSKTSRRYLLHSRIHQRPSEFARQLFDRGIPPKGYEGWESFMAARGVNVGERSAAAE
jgi:hypothetical protein